MSPRTTLHVRGARVVLRDSGRERDRSAAVLLALHGYPDTGRIYARLMEALGAVRVIAPDWPGQGESEPVDASFGPTERAAWLCELLDVLGIERCSVFGHDMGALPALALARDQQHRVRNVIVANALLSNHETTSLAIRTMRMGRAYRFAMPRLGPLVFARCMATFLERPLEASLEHDLRTWFLRHEALETIVRACSAYDDELPHALETMSGITSPTFAIWGSRARHFTVGHALALQRVLPRTERTVIDGDHWMVHEHARDVAARVSSILRR